ncbi:MAG: hypothetical protein KAY97_00190 [Chromatiaceae bacterium]|nr:hypothetical protein [Chromatiaceae bacterium]
MKTRQEELIAFFNKHRPVIYHDPRADSHKMAAEFAGISSQIKNSIWFAAGEANLFYKMKANHDLCSLPYDEMVIEFQVLKTPSDIYRSSMIKVLQKVDENKVKVANITRHSNGWHYYGSYWVIFNIDKIIVDNISYSVPGNLEDIDKHMDMDTQVLLSFLSCINCVNVKQVEHQANRQPGKASTSRKPLYSFWTLEIDKSKNQSMGLPLGGTHASPRIHLRRGHARQYKPGVYCWVQPCLVGKKEAGVIHKDYSLKAA